MLNFCDFIQVSVFTTNHHLKSPQCLSVVSVQRHLSLTTVLSLLHKLSWSANLKTNILIYTEHTLSNYWFNDPVM